VFPEWAASDDPDSGTFVATLPPEAVAESDAVAERDDRAEGDTLVEGDGAGAVAAGEPEAVVGCIQGVLLSEWEAWGQGIRVDPAARGFGVGTALSTAALDWARDRGARVCRNMVFSWNIMGLGSRAVGFRARDGVPVRGAGAGRVRLDGGSEATPRDRHRSRPERRVGVLERQRRPRPPARARARLRRVVGLLGAHPRATGDRGRRGSTARGRRRRRARRLRGPDSRDGAGDGQRDDPDRDLRHRRVARCRRGGALYDAIAGDAAAVDADAARVLIPETVEHVSDTGANRIPVAAEPDFVMSADLTGEP